MPANGKSAAWSPLEVQLLREWTALGLGNAAIAHRLNFQCHGGRPVRTYNAVSVKRANSGITAAPPILAQEQKVEREESDGAISLKSVGTRIKTVADLLAHAEIDLAQFEVSRQKANTWDTSMRGEDGEPRTVQNFQIWVEVKPKAGPNVAEQVAAMVAGAFAKRPAVQRPTPARKGTTSTLMQAVVIADPHLAKYAWGRETGGVNYDLSIASRLVGRAAADLMAWGDERRPAVRYIFCLGDVLHYDNPQGHTSGGTPQDRDTRMAKMLSEAQSVLCGLVERSATACETRVIMVPGNHDRATTLTMQMVLAAYFRRSAGVSVDVEPTHRKYVEWGQCLIGLTHGDTARKRLPSLMQVEQKEAWGRSKVREWHHGHFHREASTVTEGGVTIREHLSLSPPDSWHAIEGYVGAPRGMDTLLYDARGFLQGTWRSPVLDG